MGVSGTGLVGSGIIGTNGGLTVFKSVANLASDRVLCASRVIIPGSGLGVACHCLQLVPKPCAATGCVQHFVAVPSMACIGTLRSEAVHTDEVGPNICRIEAIGQINADFVSEMQVRQMRRHAIKEEFRATIDMQGQCLAL